MQYQMQAGNKLDASTSVELKAFTSGQAGPYTSMYYAPQYEKYSTENLSESRAEGHHAQQGGNWGLAESAKYNLQNLGSSIDYMTQVVKQLQAQVKEHTIKTTELEELITKKDKEIEHLTWLQKKYVAGRNGQYGELVDELQKLKEENRVLRARLSPSLVKDSASDSSSNKPENSLENVFGADIIFAGMPGYDSPTPSTHSAPSERGLIPPPPLVACPPQGAYESDSERKSRQSQSTFATPPGLPHPNSADFSSDDNKKVRSASEDSNDRTPYNLLSAPGMKGKGKGRGRKGSDESEEEEKELAHYLPEGTDEKMYEEYRRTINLLCRKHSVDPRTIDWFLRNVHCNHWNSLAEKCVELDRRRNENHCVKNPSAWLTKYFNTLRSGRQ